MLLFSCTKDRIFDEAPTGSPGKSDTITPGIIRINEFVAAGSTLTSNLGVSADWIELYNPGAKDVILEKGAWFVTDDLANPEKAALPAVNLPAGSYAILFCDDTLLYNGQIHLPFGLSSKGEAVGLYYKAGGKAFWVDSTSYGQQTANGYQSNARLPNGFGNWNYPVNPSPGKGNE
jgi:hypothetical protein